MFVDFIENMNLQYTELRKECVLWPNVLIWCNLWISTFCTQLYFAYSQKQAFSSYAISQCFDANKLTMKQRKDGTNIYGETKYEILYFIQNEDLILTDIG